MTSATLKASLRVATDALRGILNPLGRLEGIAKREGGHLNRHALRISRDPAYLQSIAKDALHEIDRLKLAPLGKVKGDNR